ncbi:MAG: tRNA (adenosine(37)-N6)-threonylcarbamoyltransferase complex ATPase subunit type 1 TsaE [Andreesenia angusta]|nr:tRNA (adenosine(37)-N6)-threonylcarbamoyltransferase complex ATPase subunit type 1 TsaE [Andreesenia angusta]
MKGAGKMIEIESHSPEDTYELGIKLGENLKPGDIICLNGDLGAGKTTMTKGIAKGLKIDDNITSPSFTIVNEYYGDTDFYHFDAYRIDDIEEMYDLGYEEYFFSDGISIIEWSNMIEEILPKERLVLNIKYSKEEDKRIIEIEAYGHRYEELLKEVGI